MNENPYASSSPNEPGSSELVPDQTTVDSPKGGTSRYSLTILSLICAVTLAFAAKNSVEESPELSFVLVATLAAVASQVPGLLLGLYRCYTSSWYVRLMLVPAYCVAITGLLVYGVYAFNGQADSLNSAAHMHVIVFPIMHCILATVGYVLFAATLGLIFLIQRQSRPISRGGKVVNDSPNAAFRRNIRS